MMKPAPTAKRAARQAGTFEWQRVWVPGFKLSCGDSLPEAIGLCHLRGPAPATDNDRTVAKLLGQLTERGM